MNASVKFAGGMLVVGAILFVPAGSMEWANGWLWLGTMAALMLAALVALVVKDPEALMRRLEAREPERGQRLLMTLSIPYFLGLFALPGFDWRFGWSRMPFALSLAADAFVVGGYGLFVWVMLANRWAARTVKLMAGQTLIDTGPYAVVRHPMYSGGAVLYIASAFVLGSWWAVLLSLGVPVILGFRAAAEERTLVSGLPGYADYMRKVRWRLVPGIW
ncbi:MAG: isoprenylcysteine carboxylmethyltransferase family protein [Spirochaetales bacterium]|nr:isoprenylcysteine carboxylmethyltransferase family protein [Spirochaetales bacterium]